MLGCGVGTRVLELRLVLVSHEIVFVIIILVYLFSGRSLLSFVEVRVHVQDDLGDLNCILRGLGLLLFFLWLWLVLNLNSDWFILSLILLGLFLLVVFFRRLLSFLMPR